ncbi:MAG: cytochrome b/b6 domain-containing protein [Candidatus Eremiobacteraeota bacterium]|nr:cytochrome b/b6 domain-containing protein [Candidatus Eremiobacteraeota bacterium]
MEATVGALAARPEARSEATVYRHSVTTRVSHWLFALAFVVLVMSGLQIFNAAPYLDASDKSDAHRRVLAIGGEQTPGANPTGVTQIFGLSIRTTHLFGYGDDGMGAESARAFPGWMTLPGYQDLASGRRWHLFFAWVMVACGLAYFAASIRRKDLALIVLRREDLPKLLPMQLYYLKLRKEPPPHGKYNPLQKAAYTTVLFVFTPLIVLSGVALAPGIDSIAGPLTAVFGGRQFARLWHFLAMVGLIGFVLVHVTLVLSTDVVNNIRSMITGRYRLGEHEGTGI